MTRPAIPLSLDTSLDIFVEVWSRLVGEEIESVFGGLNYAEVTPLADLVLSLGQPVLAGRIVEAWLRSTDDDDREEFGEDAAAYVALIEGGQDG